MRQVQVFLLYRSDNVMMMDSIMLVLQMTQK